MGPSVMRAANPVRNHAERASGRCPLGIKRLLPLDNQKDGLQSHATEKKPSGRAWPIPMYRFPKSGAAPLFSDENIHVAEQGQIRCHLPNDFQLWVCAQSIRSRSKRGTRERNQQHNDGSKESDRSHQQDSQDVPSVPCGMWRNSTNDRG
jgi:hypothetical protein